MIYNTSHVCLIDNSSQPEVDIRNNDVFVTWNSHPGTAVTISGDKQLLVKILTNIINDIVMPLPDTDKIDRDEFWDDEF